MGVPMDQRKRIIAAAKLGVPNPLGQLGLSMPPLSTRPGLRSRSPAQASSHASGTGRRSVALALTLPEAEPADPQARSAASAGLGGEDEDEQDLNAFLSGGRKTNAALAKAKAAEQTRLETQRREAEAKERDSREEREAQEIANRRRLQAEQKAERQRRQAELEQQEEERRREARRQARREEKERRKEEKKRQREEEAHDEEEEEAERKIVPHISREKPGFFSKAYKGNEAAKKIWSEPIKGQVSNHYRGFTDADLDRRFSAQQASTNTGQKLMTEEEVLNLLRKGKSKP